MANDLGLGLNIQYSGHLLRLCTSYIAFVFQETNEYKETFHKSQTGESQIRCMSLSQAWPLLQIEKGN